MHALYYILASSATYAGPTHYMGSQATTFLADDPLNHHISTQPIHIPIVCSFVAEADYDGLFAAARSTHRRR
jgi:hypothetical protein